MASKALFDDDIDSSSDEEVDVSERLQVNKRFAKNYQSRKQLEELRNHHESDDDSSSDDESEDEDGNLLTPSMDVSILKTINALRKKDDSIYNPDTKFFTEEAAAATKSSKTTKKHFKDVLREQILEQIDDEEKGSSNTNRKLQQKETTDRLAYDEEQKKLRSAFLVNDSDDDADKSDGEDDDDNMLVVKKKAEPVVTDQELEKEYEAFQQTNGSAPLKDPRGEVQDGDGFLIDFLKNKKWLDRDEDIDDDDEEDEPRQRTMTNNSDDDSIDDVDRADDFESKYNFRFEEAQSEVKSGADFSIMGYARSGTMDTLRRKDDSRRQARLERKERKAAERKAKEEQLRRLKNAKREEMDGKLREIKKVLGAAGKDSSEGGAAGFIMDEDAMMKLMEGDYDPEKFEKIMQEAYGDEFYEKEDSQWKSDKDVRESLLQDEDGNMLVGEDDADGGLYDNQEEEEEEGGEDGEEEEYFGEAEESGDYGDDELTAPAESKMEQKLKSKMQEELYKLDYEDIVAGMPTRFKYRKVEPNSYGLSTKEILLARDTTLKNFVSLKKMAPYRDAEEAEHTVGYKKRRRFRDMLKEDLAEQAAAEGIGEKKQPPTTTPDDGEEEQDGDGKTKKRRRQKKGKKKEKGDDTEAIKDQAVVDDLEEPTEPSKDTVEPVGGKKRRRKKGKKGSKSSEDVSAEDKMDTSIEKEPSVIADENLKEGEKKSKKKKRKTMDRDDPARKKKKRSKKDMIAGVSDSRLEAYGL
jgi:protein KRI1